MGRTAGGNLAITIALGAALAAGCLCARPAAAAADGPPPAAAERTFKKANRETIDAWIVLLRLRHDLLGRWFDTGEWPDDPAANAALEGHGLYWAEQLASGAALFAGGMEGRYWDNAAFIVFEAASQEAAEKIVAADPAVVAYVFEAQVRPFKVHFLSDKYSAGASAPPPPAEAADGPAEGPFAWTAGAWEGVRRDGADGSEAAMTMRVETILGGAGATQEVAVIHSGGVYRGLAVQVSDPEGGSWRQRYVNDVHRSFAELEGRMEEEARVWRSTSPGRSREGRLVEERLEDDRWRRTMSVSEDGGTSWRVLWIDELRRAAR